MWMEVHIWFICDDVSGISDGYVVLVRDVSYCKVMEVWFEYVVFHDLLIGFVNCILFCDRFL